VYYPGAIYQGGMGWGIDVRDVTREDEAGRPIHLALKRLRWIRRHAWADEERRIRRSASI
jgi:hypothetical protein